ncbi:hypothetical protein PFISCL1PPCAC_10622, partial [Pristionchus fissidentatus]
SGRDSNMRSKLANLLYKMGNYDKCERVLMDPIDKDKNPNDLGVMHTHVQYYMLLAKVHHEKGQFEKVNEDLQEAKRIQVKIIARSDGSVALLMKKECSKICCQIAEMYHLRRDANREIDAFKEAINYNETDIKTHLALAQAYLTAGRHELCSKECLAISAMDKNNIEAILMAADIMYSKNQLTDAMVRFDKVLDQLPSNYHALSCFIELSWREGSVQNADMRIRNANMHKPKSFLDAGFNYCNGIHEWYSGNMAMALQFFNRAKKDLEWGEKSIYCMVELLLNPENDILGVTSDENNGEETTNAAQAAKYLNELRADNSIDSKYALHETMIMMATGEKSKIQEALDRFLAMATEKENTNSQEKVKNVGAVLGAARAFVTLKQTPKAKQLLKKVMETPWSLADAENLEMCWLLLAEIYTNQNKADQAKALILKVLHMNKSSIKAFELMGFIFEKDSKWLDAVNNYTQAWIYCRQRNPTIGYKLAYNMLKAKKNFDCIVVCQKVLTQYPNYPKIRKELMEKARMSIRT